MSEPNKGESLSGFVAKYPGSKEVSKKFPKRTQRAHLNGREAGRKK